MAAAPRHQLGNCSKRGSYKVSPTDPWKISKRTLQPFQFVEGFVGIFVGEGWGIFPGYVGKIIERCVSFDVFFPMFVDFGDKFGCVPLC